MVFIVSYHNVDYAKVACEHVLAQAPDAQKIIREHEKYQWGRPLQPPEARY